ncbi:hypothetical protein PG993_008927 [Apiospora rasikravindrae]|uniref:Uncharacterized protein n=1 Tax=Apiospora rasikravindrae TaxID=990691 RepID=A0ABR1SPQ1_9PEZI
MFASRLQIGKNLLFKLKQPVEFNEKRTVTDVSGRRICNVIESSRLTPIAATEGAEEGDGSLRTKYIEAILQVLSTQQAGGWVSTVSLPAGTVTHKSDCE